MRISDWSSDVCSSDLSEMAFMGTAVGAAVGGFKPVVEIMLMNFVAVCMDQITNHAAKLRFMSGGQTHVPMVIRTMTRSEEHTSELQSLMRISYAVFCLKKKK